MPLKSEHFITPIKLVLPGIIVSLMGLFVSNYIFNDPVKIRGRNSRTAWDNLTRYEKIYEENSEELTCIYGSTNGDLFYKDLIHLQEMTIENLKMFRDDKDIDKLVGSIINLRIDTYTQLKKITSGFIDSLTKLANMILYDSAAFKENIRQQGLLQQQFLADRVHVILRDTSIIKNLGAELKRTYAAFEKVVFVEPIIPTMDTIKRRIIGAWSMLSEEVPTKLELHQANTGILTLNGTNYSFNWTFEESDGQRILALHFKDNKIDDRNYQIIHCTNKILQYRTGKNENILMIACRS
jgi:hypothetical protein